MKMKAALYYGSGDVRVESVEIPRVKSGEILVKVGTALTCGSDLKAYRQGHPVLVDQSLPSPFGHEQAGTIVEVGRGVHEFEPGMRVVAANSAPCDQCFYCLDQKPNLCDHLRCLNGAYAEYIRIPSQIVKHNLYEIPDHISFREAALSEPLACAVHALNRLPIKENDTVVILGCGIMGLLFSSVAKLKGINIIAVGRNEAKLARARHLGVDHILDVKRSANPVRDILSLTPGERGADFVIEAVGRTEAWEQAFKIVRKGGTVCFFGGCAKGSTFPVDTHRIHYEEITISGVFHHTPKHFADALGYISTGEIHTDTFVTGEVKLENISEYFYRASRTSPFKTAVIP